MVSFCKSSKWSHFVKHLLDFYTENTELTVEIILGYPNDRVAIMNLKCTHMVVDWIIDRKTLFSSRFIDTFNKYLLFMSSQYRIYPDVLILEKYINTAKAFGMDIDHLFQAVGKLDFFLIAIFLRILPKGKDTIFAAELLNHHLKKIIVPVAFKFAFLPIPAIIGIVNQMDKIVYLSPYHFKWNIIVAAIRREKDNFASTHI